MSTSYPNSIDNGNTIPASIDLVTPVKADVVNQLRDAIIAIETELGTIPSSGYSTVSERLNVLTDAIYQNNSGGSVSKPVNPTDNKKIPFAYNGDLKYANGISILNESTFQNGLSLSGLVLISQNSLINTPASPNALLYQNNGVPKFYYNSVDNSILLAPQSANVNDVLTYINGNWVAAAPTGSGGGLSNAYVSVTDGTTTTAASGSDTLRFRSANNILTTTVGSNDSTYGDNLLLTINQGNIDHGSISGLSDDDHFQYVSTYNARTITAQHTFNTSNAPFLLGTNAQGKLVTGLNSDLLDGYDSSYFVNASNLNSGIISSSIFNDSSHGLRSGGSLHSVVTSVANGFMPSVGISGTIPQSTGTGISYVSELTNPQKVTIQKATSSIGSRSKVNFIEGANVTITTTDNSSNGSVDVTIASTGGGSSSNAYSNISDGTTTATASGSDTLRFRSANSAITTTVGSNDVTYGDNLLLTFNPGNVTHSSLGSLTSSDDHTQYVSNTVARTITAQHTFNTSGVPFVLGTNAQGQLITGLNSDKLDGYDGSYYLSTVRINNGTNVGTRNRINFIPGTNVTISAVDSPINDEVQITINSSGSGSGNAYSYLTDGTNTASASGSDTIRFRSFNNILTTTITSDDPIYGDNLLLTVNQANIDHGSISGLLDDDHTQYVSNTINRSITAQHTFNYSGSPFVIGTNSLNQLVTGLNSDKLDGYDGSYYIPTVRINSGSNIGTRPRLNFIPGTNITLSAVDSSVNDEIQITVNSTASGSSSGGKSITGFSGIASTSLNVPLRIGAFMLNSTGCTSATLYVVAETSDVAATCEVKLYDVALGTFITNSIVTTTSLSASLLSSSLSLPSDIATSDKVYEIYLRNATASNTSVVRCLNVRVDLA